MVFRSTQVSIACMFTGHTRSIMPAGCSCLPTLTRVGPIRLAELVRSQQETLSTSKTAQCYLSQSASDSKPRLPAACRQAEVRKAFFLVFRTPEDSVGVWGPMGCQQRSLKLVEVSTSGKAGICRHSLVPRWGPATRCGAAPETAHPEENERSAMDVVERNRSWSAGKFWGRICLCTRGF